MASIVKKFINDFDNKWMAVPFHQAYFFTQCLLISVIKKPLRLTLPFNCEFSRIMNSFCFEDKSIASFADFMLLIKLIVVGVFALFRIAILCLGLLVTYLFPISKITII
jgi:hypothetical protein